MCVSATPGFVPPTANFDGDSVDVSLPGSAAPVKKAKKGDLLLFDAIRLLQGCSVTIQFWFFSEAVGKKRKAPGQNSSENSSQLENTTVGDKTQEVCTTLICINNIDVTQMT